MKFNSETLLVHTFAYNNSLEEVPFFQFSLYLIYAMHDIAEILLKVALKYQKSINHFMM
jgi:hypothetical protein